MRLQKVIHLLSTKHWSTHGLFLARFVEFRLNLPGTTSATLPSNCHPPAAARPWPATAEPPPPASPPGISGVSRSARIVLLGRFPAKFRYGCPAGAAWSGHRDRRRDRSLIQSSDD